MRFIAPANVQLRRAQLIMLLVTLLPTILMTATGILLLAAGSRYIAIVVGVLVLTFCTTAITGYILASIYVGRGAAMARVQNDFLSSVSHELRTPLTSIRMFMETLRDGRLEDPEEERKCMDLLSQEVTRLEGLVERLIELSRIETGTEVFARNPVAVKDIVDDSLASFHASTLSNPVDVQVDLEDGLTVVGDRAALSRVMVNLLTNAWKYTPKTGKKIAVRARAVADKEVAISIIDNGSGIPKQEQRHIFDKFERGKLAINQRTDGWGLGLATVRALVRAHKGKVELHSDADQGSEFKLILRRRIP